MSSLLPSPEHEIAALNALLPRLDVDDASSPSKPDDHLKPHQTLLDLQPSPTDSQPQIHQDSESVLVDWSGKGAHVDFLPEESVPLVQGRFLGHGSRGHVYETTIRGHTFAWKKIYCRHKIGEAERREINILKKVSHRHIIQLAGSYTHRQFLGLLLYPVALCDLATVMEACELHLVSGVYSLTRGQIEILGALEIYEVYDYESSDVDTEKAYTATLSSFRHPGLLPRIGCIISAVEYLHSQQIRHKDLKPSNILLAPNNLWLTDFGTATDFSESAVSVTDNGERGTRKYMAPEMAAFQPNGRSADIFSLGCVLLEMVFLFDTFAEEMVTVLKQCRTQDDRSFHANIESIQYLLQYPEQFRMIAGLLSPDLNRVLQLLRKMISRDPGQRPSIQIVHSEIAFINATMYESSSLLFEPCCRSILSQKQHEEEMKALRQEVTERHEKEIGALRKEVTEHKKEPEGSRKNIIAAPENEMDVFRNEFTEEHQKQMEALWRRATDVLNGRKLWSDTRRK